MIILPKHANKPLVFGLSSKEFQCNCSFDECLFTLIEKELLVAYEKLRLAINLPMHITSGFRCQRHHWENVYKKDILKITASMHLCGGAIDISLVNLLEHFYIAEIIRMAKDSGFSFVYHDPIRQFIHCGMGRQNV